MVGNLFVFRLLFPRQNEFDAALQFFGPQAGHGLTEKRQFALELILLERGLHRYVQRRAGQRPRLRTRKSRGNRRLMFTEGCDRFIF